MVAFGAVLRLTSILNRLCPVRRLRCEACVQERATRVSRSTRASALPRRRPSTYTAVARFFSQRRRRASVIEKHHGLTVRELTRALTRASLRRCAGGRVARALKARRMQSHGQGSGRPSLRQGSFFALLFPRDLSKNARTNLRWQRTSPRQADEANASRPRTTREKSRTNVRFASRARRRV